MQNLNLGFQPSERIEDPQLLFGRNKQGQLLEKLLNNLKRGTNCQLQGERRSGKTSTLLCLKTRLESSHPEIIPVYLDFKENSNITGNTNVYRYMLAKSIEAISVIELFKTKLTLRNINIKPSNYWDSAYSLLLKVSDVKIQEILKGLLNTISEKYKVGFVFLIDEYEFLFLHSLDSDNGFYPIRTLSQQPSKNNVKALTFIIAGAKSWEKFASQIGSAELNSIGAGILSVSPLYFEDFEEMWRYQLSKNPTLPQISPIRNTKDIFELSGGIPFYAKVIAESMENQQSKPNFKILLSNFEEVYKNLDEHELRIIKGVLSQQSIAEKVIAENLID